MTSDDHLPRLPSEFQGAFELAKAKADLKYATRADAFPHHPQFAESPLHRVIRIQEEFFAYCTQARNACRAGTWTVAEASHAIYAAWPFICDSYIDRELGASADEARKLRTATWRTVTDDLRWKKHLSELVSIAEDASRCNPTSALHSETATDATREAPASQHEATPGRESGNKPSRPGGDAAQEIAEGAVGAKPNLPADAWARIELVKIGAGKKLSRELVQVRNERLRRESTEKFVQGTDDAVLFQTELAFAYADFIKEGFFAEVEEWQKTGIDRAKLPPMLNTIIRTQVLSVLPMWADSGGNAEYRDWVIETAYKVVKASGRYTRLLQEIASGSTAKESDPVRDRYPLKSTGPKADTRPSAESQDPSMEESAQPAAAEPPVIDSSNAPKSSTSSSHASPLSDGDLVTAAESGRAAIVDDFLVRCNLEPGLEVELVRKHISLAFGHKYPRQFQYWQACDPRATAADNQNFGRILRMTPAEFVKALRVKRVL